MKQRLAVIIGMTLIFIVSLIIFNATNKNAEDGSDINASFGTVNIVEKMRTPTMLYVQGLEIINDELVVGTGEYGGSEIGKIDVDSETYEVKDYLPVEYFGEGITSDGNFIYQLTWKDGTLFKRDIDTFEEVDRVAYSGEGWGLCYTGEHLAKSDGSNRITFHNPEDFSVAENITVDQDQLNELECVGEYIYANVWMTNTILKIDQSTGEIVSRYDLSEIAEVSHDDAVLNGIAHIEDNKFYVTGKDWEHYYIVELN